MKRLVLLDTHAIIHRAYHALPPLTSPAGEPVGAVYGFTTILLKIIRELKPDYLAACFDMPGPTFRHAAYERYKATRPEAPSDLVNQFALVREVADAFEIPAYQKEGFEADDVIGTIVKAVARKKNVETLIVTGDQDVLQLVGPRVKVYAMKKGMSETVMYDEDAVQKRFGFSPKHIVDFKALKGDASDNIAGVRGIGEKTAVQLIAKFGSVEEIYRRLESKKGKAGFSSVLASRLETGKEDAAMSKELATIHTRVPLSFGLEEAVWRKPEEARVRGVFHRLGFMSLLKRMEDPGRKKDGLGTGMGGSVTSGTGGQQVLLGGGESARRPAREVLSSARAFDEFVSRGAKGRFAAMIENNGLVLMRELPPGAAGLDDLLFTEKRVKQFFESSSLLSHDAKSLITFLRDHGIAIPEPSFDTMLAAYVTEQFSRNFSYEAVAARAAPQNGASLVPGGREVGLPSPEKDPAERFFEIVSSLEGKMDQMNMRFVFREIEMPLTRILADMEERGILLDRAYLDKLSRLVGLHLDSLRSSIHKDAGEEFNINSSQQLSRILFEKLGLAPHGLRKTPKGGVISTGAQELEKLKDRHPIVKKVLDWRELVKLKTTYIDTLPGQADPQMGRVRTTFNQTGTSTGRLSSSDPNLQNIPVMSELGREIRKAFTAPKGWLLCSFDYSQIELRVAAHLAKDEKMVEAFGRGEDIHTRTAAQIYHVSPDKVTPDLRRAAKTLNFGVLYGMGPQAFAESTGLDPEEARTFIAEYFREFSGIRDYIERTKQFARDNGYVETLFGRRRFIPEINSPNWRMKREAERMAVNMPVQGSATGDIIKLAMIAVDKWIRKEKVGNDVRLLLQVHDELVFEVKKDAMLVVPGIRTVMEEAARLDVPLVVDVKAGDNWGSQTAFHI